MSFRRFLTSHIADPLVWTVLKHSSMLRTLAEFRVRQWDDVETFQARQSTALAALLSHAVSRVPFYTDRVSGLTPDDIERDPFGSLGRFSALAKDDLVEHFESLSCEMGRGTYIATSGGSTGEPVRFLHDKNYISAAIATTFLFFEWAGARHGDSHVKLWGAPRDIGGEGVPTRRKVADWLANRLTLDAFNMSDAAMDRYARTITRSRPVCLEGYADALYQLALRMEDTGAEPVPTRSVVSSAGTLFPHIREKIAEAFGPNIFDRYGMREVGNVAAECDRHRGLHVFGETNVVEIVDDEGRHARIGEEGEVLITNLTNYTMPLIRYRVGDRAVWGEGACDCGRPYPLLERIAGRSESRLTRRDGVHVSAEFLIYVLCVKYNDGSIRKFQVVQTSLDTILIRVVLKGGPDSDRPSSFGGIAASIRQAMGNDCSIEFRVVDEIEPTATGKHRQVIGLDGTQPADDE